MSWIEITALIVSGLLVGFINTLAGGGTIISISLFMFLGLPAGVANGTNRIAVILQTLTSTASFKKQKVLDTRKGLLLGIPTVIGSIIGAEIAVDIDEHIFEKAIGIIMLVMMVFIIYKPQQWLKGTTTASGKENISIAIFYFFSDWTLRWVYSCGSRVFYTGRISTWSWLRFS